MTDINVSNLGGRAASPWARLLAPVTMMAAIFWFSAQPYDGHEMTWWEVAGRNLGHFGGYAFLAALWAWALPGPLRNLLVAAALLALAYAAADEYHQTFVEGRTGTWEDVVLDALGIAAASVAIGVKAAKIKRGRPTTPPRADLQAP